MEIRKYYGLNKSESTTKAVFSRKLIALNTYMLKIKSKLEPKFTKRKEIRFRIEITEIEKIEKSIKLNVGSLKRLPKLTMLYLD